MLIQKKFLKHIVTTMMVLHTIVSLGQYQDTEYLNEYAKDFSDINPFNLRDAYSVMDKDFMEKLKIYSDGGSLKKITTEPLYKNVVEIQTLKEFSFDWDLELSARNAKPVLEGDVLVLIFYMKTIASQTESKLGFTRIYFQKPSPPWEKDFNENVAADSKWRKYQISYKAPKDYTPGEGTLAFALGYSFETIQLANIHLLNLGANVNIKEIPVQKFEPELDNGLAQGEPISVNYFVNTSADRKQISPFIYGTNGQSIDWDENITARRLGGNRMSSYNWENNASNAGHDYMQNNDNYMLWKAGLLANEKTPGIVMTAFHDTSLAMKTYTLMTAQMAGYVAADKDGPVDTSEKAPSPRWMEIKASKNGVLSANPNTTDNSVYMDEMINFVIKKYGKASANGINGWALDNEPGLWNSTHPLMHKKQATCNELFVNSKMLASVIKKLDVDAEVFGPMFWGYSDMHHFGDPEDWKQYKNKYPNFLSAYLGTMKNASDSVGTRLLDVLALHWYPEARGFNNKSVKERVVNLVVPGEGSSDKGVAIARMQSVRSFWDSTYKEDSWYTSFLPKPINLLPDTKATIDKYYPGTKLAITEYNFGGFNHISGGIAMADLLGVYAKYDVYMANYWSPVQEYISAGFKLYRNYDGKKSTFGDIYVKSTTTDYINSSIYAAINQADDSNLSMIILNKSYDNPINASIDIESNIQYKSAKIYTFDNSTHEIKLTGTAEITENKLVYTFPPLTAAHVVLSK